MVINEIKYEWREVQVKIADIQIGHLYYVDYEPVQAGEFNGIHLSVVLKKNNDKTTFIVMPLTSSSNGENVNKIKIGKIAGLPQDTRNKVSYAVFNQIRTVNANRIIAIKDAGRYISVPLERDIFLRLLTYAMRDLFFSLNQDEKINIAKKIYDFERFNKAKDLAYNIIKLKKDNAAEEKITALKVLIRETINGVSYVLDTKQKADGIHEIFYESMDIEI